MKILLVDDHELFRAGLRMLLATIEPEATALEASSLGQALSLVDVHDDVELCLLALSLKNEGGLEALHKFKAAAPDMAVVVVARIKEIPVVYSCIDAGASGFRYRSAFPQVLTKALHEVLSGAVYLPEQMLNIDGGASMNCPALTPRQLEVLRALSLGLPTKSIARQLGISVHTVNEHIALIFQALGVHNRTQAAVAAARYGL